MQPPAPTLVLHTRLRRPTCCAARLWHSASILGAPTKMSPGASSRQKPSPAPVLPPALCCVATDRRCVKAELPASRRPSRRLSHCAIAPARGRRFETQLAARSCTLMQCPARPAICIAMEHDIPHCPPSRCHSCICSAKSAAALPEPASGLTRTNWQPWSNCSASCLRVEARPPAHEIQVCIVCVAGGSVSQRAQINSCLWHADAAGARVAPQPGSQSTSRSQPDAWSQG